MKYPPYKMCVLYAAFLFWPSIYRQIYSRKFSFVATRERSRNLDFRTCILRFTSPNEKFEYGYPNTSQVHNFQKLKNISLKAVNCFSNKNKSNLFE